MAELRPSDLQAATNRTRLDLLQTDLGLCFAFVDVAKTERQMGNRDAARHALEKAETGYATMARFLADVEHGEQKLEIAQKLGELRARLDTEHDCLDTPGAA